MDKIVFAIGTVSLLMMALSQIATTETHAVKTHSNENTFCFNGLEKTPTCYPSNGECKKAAESLGVTSGCAKGEKVS